MKKTYILLQFIILLLLVDNVKAQLKLGDQPTSVQKSVILDLQGSNGRQGVWLPRISDTTDATGIDGLNPPDGVLIYHTPSSQVMIRKNGFWSSLQTTTKVGSTTSTNNIIEFQLGTVAGAGKDLNYSLNSSTGVVTLNVPDAAVDTRGVVTIGSQTFGGVKTFNNGLTSLSTTTISGASSNASNLYLGINSSTTPGTTTDRFLTVDNSGRVVLAQGTPSNTTITINGTTYDLTANRTWNVGTVTSVAGGYGINGGTITTTGTLSIDTSAMATRAWRQKGIDSLASLINGYVPSTRTLNGLSLSSNQTFAVGTSGTDFNIVSSGTTHTFNIPTASSTTRGLLSSADWTTFNNKGTVSSVGAGYGINGGTITTTGTHSVDTTIISTRSWRQKGIDSVAGLLNSYIPSTRTITINGTAYDLSANRSWSVGTVTSIAAGYGINGGTITSTGTHSVDTTIISTRAWRQKGIDSVASLINGFIPATRTLNGLALSSNQTFAVGTSGTDFNIVSSGTTHTFNIPDASSSARGLVTTGTQTFAGSKTFNNTVTAKVLLQAGTATAGTAPLKFTSGTNLSTPENGAIEYDGTNYFATSGGIRYTIAKTLTATATLDFPSTDGAGGSSSLNVTVTGAAVGDVVSIGIPPSAMVSGGTYNAYVSAANTVTIVFTNSLVAFFGIGITADPGSGTFRVSVTKY